MKCSYFSSNAPGPKLDNTVKAKVLTFLEKLQRDDASPGLHIEPMNNPADSRARTGRVDGSWRAVLYQLDTKLMGRVYVYDGTWPHDDAIKRARTKKLNYNIVNGLAEFIAVAGEVSDESSGAAIPATPAMVSPKVSADTPYLDRFGFVRADLIEALGFDEASADRLWSATTEDAAMEVAVSFPSSWQQDAAQELICGTAVADIRAMLSLDERVPVDPTDTEDDRIAKALLHPASRMQFTFVSDDAELARIIDEGDFGAWRVFLHPEQAKYATQQTSGPFRLTGGAGTGKTVVLLHRTKHLVERNPSESVVLTTYTKALADNLKRDLDRLDPEVPQVTGLGEPGVLVKGVDALAAAVRQAAGRSEFADAGQEVLGYRAERIANVEGAADRWTEAAAASGAGLEPRLKLTSFLDGEYVNVILPNRIRTQSDYFAVRRPGRGVALDRRRRAAIWSVVEQYRELGRHGGVLSFDEVTTIATRWLERNPDSPLRTDHLLVDEAQDLTPGHWQFLRALARPGADDLFIAEDTHQRIYGQHITFSHLGIKIVGRSRRLRLNYRTTEQNLGYAMSVLAKAPYRDSEGEAEDTTGYRSLRRGPMPETIATTSRDELDSRVAAMVGDWTEEGVEPASIAVLARTNEGAKHVKAALHDRGVEVNYVTSATAGGDRPITMTMHTAKGMEFSRVVLYDVSDGIMPSRAVVAAAAEEERDDVMLRERSLLYVAASRARDVLVVTWRGEASALLGGAVVPA